MNTSSPSRETDMTEKTTSPKDTSSVGVRPHKRSPIGTAMRALTALTGSEFAEKKKKSKEKRQKKRKMKRK